METRRAKVISWRAVNLGKAAMTSFILAGLAWIAPAAQAQQQVFTLWPHGTPEPAQTDQPEHDMSGPQVRLINGRRPAHLTNVTRPTLSVFFPPSDVTNTHAAALVFPGGGYKYVSWDAEGIDTCAWLNSIGTTCLLVKYRVPEMEGYPSNPADLEDAQQAMRIARAHTLEWKIDPDRIGVVGFSAGGNLAVLLCTYSNDRHVESTPAVKDVDTRVDARPDFAIIVYPAYLVEQPEMTKLNPVYAPNELTPPTFLLQAEDDRDYGKNAPLYFQALAAAHVPTELHMYATGGHGFAIHPVGTPEENWAKLADTWLHSINVLPR